jgi:hypothetical protein
MTQFSYDFPLHRIPAKVIDIYGESGKIGIVKGFYGNVFAKMLDKIGQGCYLDYEFRDSKNNIRVISKDIRGFTRRKILVKYIDDDKVEHKIMMNETKCFDIAEEMTFVYKNQEYVINKEIFEPVKLLLDGSVIADCKVQFTNYAYNVRMNIYNQMYVKEHYLLLGLFHVSLS